ncbi:MAG: hypothetical protein ACI4QM_03850 [Alphaproteobacteria bacterium]
MSLSFQTPSSEEALKTQFIATMRLLSQKHRRLLMDFILQERKRGACYIADAMLETLTSFPVRMPVSHCVADFVIEEDLRTLPHMDEQYPLYLKYNRNKKEIFETINRYAVLCYTLPEEALQETVHQICEPDTKTESAAKRARYKKLTKWALKLHTRKYEKDSYYKWTIDMMDQDKLPIYPKVVATRLQKRRTDTSRGDRT